MNPLTRTSATAALLGLVALLGTLLAACQDDYLVPPRTTVAPPGTAAPRARELPEPTTPFEPPPGAFTLLTLYDEGCDGVAGYCAWTTYDAAGQLLHQERRVGCDSDSPSCELTWRSEEGATVTAYDDRCDGRLRGCEHNLETERRTLSAVDEDCDGAFDVRHVTERDARGVVVLARSEYAQGTAEASCRTSWPDAAASGEPLYDSEDEGCDGVLEHCRVILRDAAGLAVGLGTDAGCDGVYEACELNTLGGPDSILATPEGAGCQGATLSCKLSEQRADTLGTWSIDAVDPACDGHPVMCKRTLLDLGGQWLIFNTLDEDCDGVDECVYVATTLEHDGEVRTFATQEDNNCDGVPETCTRWTQGASGVVFSEVRDLGCDGTDDNCYHTTHDAAGRVLDAWYGCDEPESCAVLRYDEAGHVIYRQVGSCEQNGRSCIHQGYDAMGHLNYTAEDFNCDGRLDACSSSILDARGFLLSATHDDSCDGQPEACEASTWDPRGFLLSSTWDDGCDGRPEVCIETIPVD